MKRLESDETPEDEDAQLRAARLGVIANVAVFAGIILLLKTGEMNFYATSWHVLVMYTPPCSIVHIILCCNGTVSVCVLADEIYLHLMHISMTLLVVVCMGIHFGRVTHCSLSAASVGNNAKKLYFASRDTTVDRHYFRAYVQPALLVH